MMKRVSLILLAGFLALAVYAAVTSEWTMVEHDSAVGSVLSSSNDWNMAYSRTNYVSLSITNVEDVSEIVFTNGWKITCTTNGLEFIEP